MSTGVAKVTLGDSIECFDNHIASSVALWFGSILTLWVPVCTNIHSLPLTKLVPFYWLQVHVNQETVKSAANKCLVW